MTCTCCHLPLRPRSKAPKRKRVLAPRTEYRLQVACAALLGVLIVLAGIAVSSMLMREVPLQ
jgi:hypothetical protein